VSGVTFSSVQQHLPDCLSWLLAMVLAFFGTVDDGTWQQQHCNTNNKDACHDNTMPCKGNGKHAAPWLDNKHAMSWEKSTATKMQNCNNNNNDAKPQNNNNVANAATTATITTMWQQ